MIFWCQSLLQAGCCLNGQIKSDDILSHLDSYFYYSPYIITCNRQSSIGHRKNSPSRQVAARICIKNTNVKLNTMRGWLLIRAAAAHSRVY